MTKNNTHIKNPITIHTEVIKKPTNYLFIQVFLKENTRIRVSALKAKNEKVAKIIF